MKAIGHVHGKLIVFRDDMTRNSRSGGALIAMALFFAVIGILVGLGRLKAHEFRVQRRIERQYAVDKVLATRSALNMILWNKTLLENSTPVSYTNTFCCGSGEELEVRVMPIPPLISEDLANTNDITAEKWSKNDGTLTAGETTKDTRVQFNQLDMGNRVAKFSCINATGSVFKSCSIFKALPVNWLDTQFGLVYRIDPHALVTTNGFYQLRFYLVGMDDAKLSADNLDYYLSRKQSFMLETKSTHVVTNDGTITSEVAIRDFHLKNMPFAGSDICMSDCIDSTKKNNDLVMQGTGFILSGFNAVTFGENSKCDKLFSGPMNLMGLVNTNAFTNAWVVIEHVFPTNFPSARALVVSLASFQVFEPMTYGVSVFNKKMGSDYDPPVSTWEFLTRYPDNRGGKDDKGEFCVIDTFGPEASSLRRERQGKLAEP